MKKRWQRIKLWDTDGTRCTVGTAPELFLELLRSYRQTGTIEGWFFENPRKGIVWNVCPEIDWTDFPKEVKR